MLFLLQHLSPFSCSLSCRRTNPLRLSSTSRNCFHIALSLLFFFFFCFLHLRLHTAGTRVCGCVCVCDLVTFSFSSLRLTQSLSLWFVPSRPDLLRLALSCHNWLFLLLLSYYVLYCTMLSVHHHRVQFDSLQCFRLFVQRDDGTMLAWEPTCCPRHCVGLSISLCSQILLYKTTTTESTKQNKQVLYNGIGWLELSRLWFRV